MPAVPAARVAAVTGTTNCAPAGASKRIQDPKTFVCQVGVQLWLRPPAMPYALLVLKSPVNGIDEGVRERQPERTGADDAVAVRRRSRSGRPDRH